MKDKMPKGWGMFKIGDIALTTSGGTPNRSVKEYWGGNIPWLKSGELNDGFITRCEEFITDAGLKYSSAKIFKKDSLLLALYGATAGKLGFLGFDSTTNQAVCCITPNEKLVDIAKVVEREEIDDIDGVTASVEVKTTDELL